MAFIPLEGVDGVLGKFMLYYGEPHCLSSEELQLASVIAAQIAFAVERTQVFFFFFFFFFFLNIPSWPGWTLSSNRTGRRSDWPPSSNHPTMRLSARARTA